MAQLQITEGSGLSKHMSKKLQMLLPVLKSQPGVEEGTIDLLPGENWAIRTEVTEFYKTTIAGSDLSKEFSYPIGIGGDIETLRAIAVFTNRHFKPSLPVEPDHIVTASGSGNLLDAVAQVICDEGDAVLVAGPCWGGYQALLRLHANINVVTANPQSFRGACTSEILPALEKAYSGFPQPERIKALLVSSPHNPVGRCYPAETIRGMMRFCNEHGLHYISDEVFALSVLPHVEDAEDAGPPFVSALTVVGGQADTESNAAIIDRSRVHVLWSLSKDFASSGVRFGALVSQSNELLLVGAVTGSFWQSSLPNALYARKLLGSERALELVKINSARLSANYAMLTARLRKLGIEYISCRAGFGLYARLEPNADSWDVEAALVARLRDHGVAVHPGRVASGGVDGEMGWVRISFAVTSEILAEGLDRIEKALRSGSN